MTKWATFELTFHRSELEEGPIEFGLLVNYSKTRCLFIHKKKHLKHIDKTMNSSNQNNNSSKLDYYSQEVNVYNRNHIINML